ncbi:MAG: GNAT family N-acetyltransferase [Alphaproteobacteria bacterium]
MDSRQALEQELFGDPDQRQMLARGQALTRLLDNDPRFCSHGRGVQVATNGPEAPGLVEDIARLVGVGACENVPRELVKDFADELSARGLKVDVIARFTGGEKAIEAAREVVASRPLPRDLTVKFIDKDAPRAWLEAFASVALPHGVLPPAGSVMRGLSKPGFAMVVFDRVGQPVACAGSVMNHHPASEEADMAQWGQLATHPSRQGEGIARALGAMALIASHERLGARRFKTGVRTDNVPSTRLCNSLGVTDSGSDIVSGIDPEVFKGDRLTK